MKQFTRDNYCSNRGYSASTAKEDFRGQIFSRVALGCSRRYFGDHLRFHALAEQLTGSTSPVARFADVCRMDERFRRGEVFEPLASKHANCFSQASEGAQGLGACPRWLALHRVPRPPYPASH